LPPNRYAFFSQRQETVFPFAIPIAPPAQTVEQKQAIDFSVEVDKQSRARSVEFAARDTSFARYGVLSPIRFDGPRGTVEVLNFTVPGSQVLIVQDVDIYISEPACLANRQFGWRLVSDQGQVLNHTRQANAANNRTDILFGGFGSIEQRPGIAPVYFQAGERMALELIEISTVGGTTFDENVSFSAWVYGELRKTAGGR